ncbi:MAG: hypothetical protein V4753_09320 [Pseudomonadota bacterium]
MRLPLALGLVAATALPLAAQTCGVDPAAIEARIAELEASYGAILSDIDCDAPTLPSQVLLCDSAEAQDDALWRMGRLDDLAWVYAFENATGQEVDLANPPRDSGFLAERDACTDEACLCEALVAHTNGSLGGTSPYPQ